MWLAMFAAVFVGALIGLINGLAVTRLKVNPLIATLGMMSITRSAALVVSQGYPLANIPTEFTVIGQGYIGMIPISVIISLVLVVIGDTVLRKTVYFQQVYFIGGNEKAALYSGIPVNRIKVATYIIVGILAAFAGVISTSRLSSAFPQAGLGTEMRVSACVIDGLAFLDKKGESLAQYLE